MNGCQQPKRNPSTEAGQFCIMKKRRPPIPQPKRPFAIGANLPSAAAQANAARLKAAVALHQQGRLDQARAIYIEILQSQPQHFDALQLLATIAAQQKHSAAALEFFDQALKINPNHASSLNNRGNALRDLKRFDDALQSYDRALRIRPEYAEALYNRGIALRDLKRLDEALRSYDRSLEIQPGIAETLNDRGVVLSDLKRHEEALASYDRALRIKPDFADALHNRGHALRDLKRHEEALESYGRALKIKPDYEFLYGTWLHTRMRICDWPDLQKDISVLIDKISCGEKALNPFALLAISSSPALQRQAAEICGQDKNFLSHALPELPVRRGRDKIRVGYFSADYHNHATTYLMAELFERHDRSRFELIAFSYGPATNDEMRTRVVAAFDKFIDVRTNSDMNVALLSRKLEVDIAVDLKGFTQDSRPGIFASRAAPLQVNYLGYPGTTGAKYIDYLIADPTLIPEVHRQHYSEKIAYLPNSYQVNDAKRRISDKGYTREELGLPQTGFVFCCFNNSYKITPGIFDSWTRMLKEVDGSVLWLLEDNPKAASNLIKEAGLRGVNAERLIFAKRMPLADHLARHRLADLFLDTLPCNAHTTASDALWAGLPVLTCVGEAFASRVAASLLNAIHLPELITTTTEEYEALAIELATNPGKLKQIRHKLEKNRLTTPLFDTRLFTRHIEAAYYEMYERYQAGFPPDHIHVQS